MNENLPPNTETTSSATDEDAGPLAGQRLAIARRENDISIAEIAKELHLDEPKVQALEENLFDVLGAPVFAKGHLRKYAELVGVSTDDVLADYYKLNRSVGAPPVVGPKMLKPPTALPIGRWIAGILVVIIVAGTVHWWLNREPAPNVADVTGVLEPFATDRGTGAGSVTEPADVAPANAAPAAAGTAQSSAPQVTGEAETDVVPAANPGSVAAASEGELQIALTYTGDCWTEVTDVDGERLFFGLGSAGQTVIRNGKPPLRALFGDAGNVSVTVNGVDFPLTRGSRRGNTVRITIND